MRAHCFAIVFLAAMSARMAQADPSTSSIGIGDLSMHFEVKAALTKTEVQRGEKFWIVMPNLGDRAVGIRLTRLITAPAVEGGDPWDCDIRDCAGGRLEDFAVAPDEHLLIDSNRKILGLTLEMRGSQGWRQIPQLTGFYTSCDPDKFKDTLEEIFDRKQRIENAALVPLPLTPDSEISFTCLK